MCGPGENGVVLTNYRTFGEDRSYEWNAVPLNVYLYGVEDESARPLYASPTMRWMLQERYREKYLAEPVYGELRDQSKCAVARDGSGQLHPRCLYVHGENYGGAGPRADRKIQSGGERGPLQRGDLQLRGFCPRAL